LRSIKKECKAVVRRNFYIANSLTVRESKEIVIPLKFGEKAKERERKREKEREIFI